MLALINETISFLDFAMIVEMGIKNGYPQFQGDDNKIGLIMAFFARPRGKEVITESQFSNFVTNIEINDPQKKDRSFKEFRTKNRIGKILSYKEEIKTPQRLEPIIEIKSIPVSQFFEPSNHNLIEEIPLTPASTSNHNVIEIKSVPPSTFFNFSNMVSPQLIQETETPGSQLIQGITLTSDLFFPSPGQNFNSAQSTDLTQQKRIQDGSKQSFREKQLRASKSKKCCTIL